MTYQLLKYYVSYFQEYFHSLSRVRALIPELSFIFLISRMLQPTLKNRRSDMTAVLWGVALAAQWRLKSPPHLLRQSIYVFG
jgi:hypothetical protein